jgi:hypothetical protein
MLLELHHWSFPVLNETDVDDLLPYIVYYPEWKRREAAGSGDPRRTRQVFADQVEL